MESDSDVIQIHFDTVLRDLENRVSRAAVGAEDTYQIFGHVDDDLFAFLGRKNFSGYERVKLALPDYPAEEISADCTGHLTLHEAVREALVFWKRVKEIQSTYSQMALDSCKVVDFGAGWGRMTRMLAKDVPSRSLFAVEPNPVFGEIFAKTRVPGALIASDYLSERTLPIRDVNLMISFSILTHASDRLAHNICQRWSEIMAPGGLVIFTIRPGSFLATCEGEMAKFSPPEHEEARRRYADGHLAYKPYSDSPDWGVTIAPMKYITELFQHSFRIVGPQFFFHNPTQLPILMIRK